MSLGPKALGRSPNQDANFEKVVTLQDYEGNIQDHSVKAKSWPPINAVSAQYTATNAKFGGQSLYIPLVYSANSCPVLRTTSTTSDFAWSNNKFTIEFWFYPTYTISGVYDGYTRTTAGTYGYFGGLLDFGGAGHGTNPNNFLFYSDHGRPSWYYQGASVPFDNALAGGWYGPRPEGDTRVKSGTPGTSRPASDAEWLAANQWNWVVIQGWDRQAGSATALQGIKIYINGKLHNINSASYSAKSAYGSGGAGGTLLASWWNASEYTLASTAEPATGRRNQSGYFDGLRITNGVVRYANLGTGSDLIPVPTTPPLP